MPGVTVTVWTLDFSTYVLSMSLFNDGIDQPSTCGLFGGLAELTTRVVPDDSYEQPPVVASVTQPWVCVAPGLFMFAL